MRIQSRPIEVQQDGHWLLGTLRSWEVDGNGEESGIVTFRNDHDELEVGRFPASQLRDPPTPAPDGGGDPARDR